MSLAKKIAHNTLIQTIGKIVSTILGLFSLALITRYLGQAGFGEYTTIYTFLTFFAVIADLGLTLITVQMISGETEDENKILNNLFSLRLLSALFFIGLAPVIVIFLPYSQEVKFGVLITAIAFIFPALNQILIGLFQKRLSMDRSSLAEIVSRIVLLLGIIISGRLNGGLNGVLIATVISGAINFILHYVLALKFVTIKFAFNLSLWKMIIGRSWPLALTIILNLIYLRADTLLLSLFKDNETIGIYGAAYRIIDVITTLPFMFAGLILPILTTAWLEKKLESFQKILQKSFDFMAMMAIPLLVGTQFLSKNIMISIAGRDFAEAGPILQVLIFSVAAIFLGTIFTHATIAINKQKKLIGFYAFTSASSLLAYLILIPRYSYFGAAAVTIYSEVMIMFFSAYCVYKYSRFLPNLLVSGKSLIASLVMGAFLYLIPQFILESLIGLIISLAAAIFLYFILLYFLGGIKSEEIKAILRKQSKGGSPTYDPGSNF